MKRFNFEKDCHRQEGRFGFTLVEVMVALAVFSILSVGVIQFTLSSSRGMQEASIEMGATKSSRDSLMFLEFDAREATYVSLYDSYGGAFRNVAAGGDFRNVRLDMGDWGNFILFVHVGEDLNLNDANAAPIERIVGYYLDANGVSGEGSSLRRFEVVLNNVFVGDDVEPFIPANTNTVKENHREVASSVEGVLDGSIFYRVRNETFMLSARVWEGVGRWRDERTISSTLSLPGV